MLYQKAKIKDNRLVITGSKEIDQNKLTSDCWLIQWKGISACEGCDLRNTPECGGGETLKRMNKHT